MNARFISGVILASSLAVLFAACNQPSNSTLQPTPAPVTTDNFGPSTIQPLQTSQTYQFTETLPGSITVTLTSAGPPSSYILQATIGTPSASACVPVLQQNAQAGVGVPV